MAETNDYIIIFFILTKIGKMVKTFPFFSQNGQTEKQKISFDIIANCGNEPFNTNLDEIQ